jgi:hypothetical protein
MTQHLSYTKTVHPYQPSCKLLNWKENKTPYWLDSIYEDNNIEDDDDKVKLAPTQSKKTMAFREKK